MISCPACGAGSATILNDAPLQHFEGTTLPEEYQLATCVECGVWFKHPRPDAARLAAHYERMRPEESAWNYADRLPHERHIDRLLAPVPDGAAVLDVGCWTGRLLVPHATRLRAFGVEPNEPASHVATRAGVRILGGSVDALRADAVFETITMVDVFEHLADPIDVIERLVRALSPSGTLLIVSGRTDCLAVRLVGASYWYFACPDHLTFLNRRFVAALPALVPASVTRYQPVRHFTFNWRQFWRESAWLLAWRFLSPHSPFRKPPMHRIPGLRRAARLRRPLVCGMWRDHALLQLRRA